MEASEEGDVTLITWNGKVNFHEQADFSLALQFRDGFVEGLSNSIGDDEDIC